MFYGDINIIPNFKLGLLEVGILINNRNACSADYNTNVTVEFITINTSVPSSSSMIYWSLLVILNKPKYLLFS